MTQQRDSQGRFTKSETNGSYKETHNLREFIAIENAARAIRQQLSDQILDDRRDVDHECGYASTDEIDVEMYRRLYNREGIAKRVVNLYPDESWIVNPIIEETTDSEENTQFEQDFSDLSTTLKGEQSWCENDETHPLWESLHRIDCLSGIGKFGVLLLGIDDGKPLNEPVEFRVGKKSANLIYLNAFDEKLIEIRKRDNDSSSSRFGMPETYNLHFEAVDTTGLSRSHERMTTEIREVHWSRVIHVADNIESSKVFGTPRMQPNYNRLYDLRKVLGGSAEMYWRGALPPLFLTTDPDWGPKTKMGVDSKSAMEQMMNTLQRWAFAPGIKPIQLDPTVVSPEKQVNSLIEAICIELACPKRIFMGSERGELSSSQDARAWNSRMIARQQRYLIPRLITKTIDRLISIGVLTEPQSYTVSFPNLNKLSAEEQAEIARKRIETVVKYVQGDGMQALTEVDFWTTIMGLTEEEALGIVERVEGELTEGEDDSE